MRPPTPRKDICAEQEMLRSRRNAFRQKSKRRTKEWPIIGTWGLGDVTNLKNKKDVCRSGSEGRRCTVVKFAKLVMSGDQEEDFGEHRLCYTLTLIDVEAKYCSGQARDW